MLVRNIYEVYEIFIVVPMLFQGNKQLPQICTQVPSQFRAEGVRLFA